MKLSELNETQRKDRNLFVTRVQETGWELDTGTEEMLANELSVSPGVLAKVRHGEFVSQMALSFKEGMLIYQIVRSTSGEKFSHCIYIMRIWLLCWSCCWRRRPR